MTDTSPAAVAQMIAAPWCYASADIADTLRAVAAERDALAAAIKRQAGAAASLRKFTLDEVKHLKEIDRSEYCAVKAMEVENTTNAMLTEECERLTAEHAAALAAAERAVRAALEAAAELAGRIMRDAVNVPINHQELTMTLWENIHAIAADPKAMAKIIEGAQDAKR